MNFGKERSKTPNADEQVVENHLRSLQLGTVCFEPIQSESPDFLVGDTLAVEVRRLNQNFYHKNGEVEGLETKRIDMSRAVQQVLDSFGPARTGTSWFVDIDFRRPLGASINETKAIIRSALAKVLPQLGADDVVIRPTRSITMTIFPASRPSQQFVLAGCQDRDLGGFVLAEILKSLTFSLARKNSAIQKNKHLYSDWWLILVDHIGLNPSDHSHLRELCTVDKGDFSKVIIVSPRPLIPAFIL